VVSGYVSAGGAGKGSIRVRYAESQRGQVKFPEEKDYQELFDPQLFPGPHWEAPFYRSLAEEDGVDAVLLLGGETSTLIAGQIAVARRLPILTIDEFGGSAAKIWNQIAQAFPNKNYHAWATRSVASHVARLKEDCAALAQRRAQMRAREQAFSLMTAQRTKILHAAAAFVCLLATLFFGMVYTPYPAVYPFITFAGLIAAGATGALTRVVLWGPPESDPRASLLLGSIAGFVVGLAYLIPQWVGAPGVLAPDTNSISATDKIQLASAILVAISAGVGFDTVFNRLQEQAREVPIAPSRTPGGP
jgi:hypothetical protein